MFDDFDSDGLLTCSALVLDIPIEIRASRYSSLGFQGDSWSVMVEIGGFKRIGSPVLIDFCVEFGLAFDSCCRLVRLT